jgi:hypothetical protein
MGVAREISRGRPRKSPALLLLAEEVAIGGRGRQGQPPPGNILGGLGLLACHPAAVARRRPCKKPKILARNKQTLGLL